MARPLRIEFPGAIYHVTARGNAREAIVRDDADCDLFLDALDEVVTASTSKPLDRPPNFIDKHL